MDYFELKRREPPNLENPNSLELRKGSAALKRSLREWWFLWLIGGVVVGFAQLLVLWAWYSANWRPCASDVFDRIASQNGTQIAYVEEGSCGAFGDYYAGVMVVPADKHNEQTFSRWVLFTEGPTAHGNLLRSISARWVQDELVVAYDERLKVLRQQVPGVRVRYEPFTAVSLSNAETAP